MSPMPLQLARPFPIASLRGGDTSFSNGRGPPPIPPAILSPFAAPSAAAAPPPAPTLGSGPPNFSPFAGAAPSTTPSLDLSRQSSDSGCLAWLGQHQPACTTHSRSVHCADARRAVADPTPGDSTSGSGGTASAGNSVERARTSGERPRGSPPGAGVPMQALRGASEAPCPPCTDVTA